jgi:hypothetical protein
MIAKVSKTGYREGRLEKVTATVCLLVALLAGPLAAAQSSARSAEVRAAQYVLVLDDSGSMKGTDPDRLGVFAVRSLVGMLDDRDEVSVVRLNGPRDGAPPPPIEPLRKNRKSIEQLLDPNPASPRWSCC